MVHMRINLCCLLWGVLGVVSAQAEAPAYIGIIEPRQVISVGSAVPGIVEHLPVDRGHVIKKGDLLAELNSDVEAIDHTLAKTRYELMKNRYDRQAALASNALTSQEEVERARIEMELAKLEMERRAVMVEQKSIRSSVLNRTSIKAIYFLLAAKFVWVRNLIWVLLRRCQKHSEYQQVLQRNSMLRHEERSARLLAFSGGRE